MTQFGERLRECRENRGIKRQELAALLGVSRNTIGLWERGERLPRSLELVYELADILQVSVLYFSAADERRQGEEIKRNPVILDLEQRVRRLEKLLGQNALS